MVPAIIVLVAFALAWPGSGRAENVLRWQSAISGLTYAFNHAPTEAQSALGLRSTD